MNGRTDRAGVHKQEAIQIQYERALCVQEAFWRQRAKKHRLDEGDRNTKFFHAASSYRRKVNNVVSLKDQQGQMVTWETGMRQLIIDYFSTLFTSTEPCMADNPFHLPSRVTDEQNHTLLLPGSAKEIRMAVFQMGPDKSPGPDGLNPRFYQHYWPVVADAVVLFVQGVLASGTFDPRLNDTDIVLIPKNGILMLLLICAQ